MLEFLSGPPGPLLVEAADLGTTESNPAENREERNLPVPEVHQINSWMDTCAEPATAGELPLNMNVNKMDFATRD